MKINKTLAQRLTSEQLEILQKYVKERNEIPIRVVYTQEYWDEVANDPDYNLANRELTALRKSIPKIADHLAPKKINIVHLGVGNGVEVPIIVDAIQEKNISNYSIVDVNPKMLDITEQKNQENYPGLKISRFCTDIETYGVQDVCEQTKKNGSRINVVVLIANGVLFSNDDLVREIYSSMTGDDYFFLTLELYKKGKDEEIIQPYLVPTVLDLLSNGAKILGYEPQHDEFSAEIDKDDKRLKVYYSPNKDASKKLLVLHSYKPNIKELIARMEGIGFKNVFCEEYQEIHTCACLFKR